jgi:DNA-binding winged helix-turn-helix (wHTH) protein
MRKIFAEFEFDDRLMVLKLSGRAVRLNGQAIDLLALLLERAGETISRDEIQRRLWPDRNVEFDHSLDVLVSRLRSALGETSASPRFIVTIPKKGYRFIGNVSSVPARTSHRIWLRRIMTYAAIALIAALGALLFARTRYERVVPSHGHVQSDSQPSVNR